MTSHELFATMPADLAMEIIEFNHASEKKLYRAALETVAQSRKVRAVFLERQPRVERCAAIAASLSRPAMHQAADSLLRNWLLKKHTSLLTDFLEALGIQHENGVVEALPKTVDDERLKVGIESLLARHPREAVAIYLHAFNSMNGENWTNLEVLLRTNPRLRLVTDA